MATGAALLVVLVVVLVAEPAVLTVLLAVALVDTLNWLKTVSGAINKPSKPLLLAVGGG
jgi:hypothetical protein